MALMLLHVLLQLFVFGSFAAAASFEADCVAAHNRVRSAEDVPALEWSEKLAAYALRYAEQQRDHHECAMVHSRGEYGENLFWGSGKPYTVSDAVRSWAKEADHYDWDSNSCAPGKVCGHYTQLVWADTKAVGCAAVACHDGATFVICSYDPPGNFVGERPFQRSNAKAARNRSPTRKPDANGGEREVSEKLNDAEARLCQCMLSCISKAKSSPWHESTTQ